MNARDAILGRVREALRDVPDGEAIEPLAYEPPAPSGNAVARFAERVADYRATVREADALAETIARVCAEHGARRLGIPAGLLEGWRPDGLELVEDDGLSLGDLDALDGALTGCVLAIAARSGAGEPTSRTTRPRRCTRIEGMSIFTGQTS